MRRRRLVRIAVLAVFLPLLSLSAEAKDQQRNPDQPLVGGADQVTLYIPAFQSDDANLGLAVATVMNLQVWQTLRKSPTPNPDSLDFGSGVVVWDKEPLSSADFETAEQAAAGTQDPPPQLVLWGKCYRYGEGVVAQAYLSLPVTRSPRPTDPELWLVFLPGANGDALLESGIPTRRYAFEPIVLTRQVVETYSRPDALKLYAAQDGERVVGQVGDELVALRHAGPSDVEVQSGAVTGWLRLPSLARERSEVTDFTGGVLRAYRGDWMGVRSLMKKVADNPQTPTQLRVDAHLYRALAAVKLNRDPEPDLSAAEALNPYARRVVVYRAMALLSDYADSSADAQRAILDRVEQLVAERHYVFLPDDPWLAQWTAALAYLRQPG
jgi:hypothetical protein